MALFEGDCSSRVTRGRRAMSAPSGFSMIELLIVVVVVTVLSGLSVLSYRSFHKGRSLSEASRRIVSMLSVARERAIAQNELSRAVVDIDEGRLWIDQGTPRSATYRPKVVHPFDLPELVRIRSVTRGGTEATAGIVAIQFEPDGTAEAAAILLADESDAGTSTTVKVYHSTGRARADSPAGR